MIITWRCVNVVLVLCAVTATNSNLNPILTYLNGGTRPPSVQPRPNHGSSNHTDPRFTLSTMASAELTDIQFEAYTKHSMLKTKGRSITLLKDGMKNDAETENDWLMLLLQRVLEQISNCSLVMAVDPIYLTSFNIFRLTALPHPKQVVVVRDERDLLKVVWGGSLCRVYLFLLQHPQPLLSFADKHIRAWDYYAKYIIVGLTVEELEALTYTKKGRKTQHIVGLVKSEKPGEWKVYINQLYSRQNVKLLTNWRFTNFTYNVDIFPDKISNLHGATLNVTVFFEKDEAGNPRIYGRDVEVVRALAAACNFILNFREVPQGEVWGELLPNGSWNGLIGMLGSGDGDLGIANIFITSLLGRRDYQHFSAPFHQSVNCVILRVSPPVPRWQAPSWPFRSDTWITLAVGLILSGPVIYVLAYVSAKSLGKLPFLQSLTSSYFHVFAMHLREPLPREPSTNASRLSVAFLWIYVMVLGISYSSNLTAFLTVVRQPRSIDTFKELLDSDLPVVGLGPIFGNLMKTSVNVYLKELFKNFVSMPSEPELLLKEGRAGYLTSYHNSEYFIAQVNSEYSQPIVRSMKVN
ncbi:hypothetical protein Pmani_015790 [Petrolisthes manimaculis]|uniref:Ionotropic glutamate receptor L-glutamate and glycine-binding domain-containing protein n=1 Tax=Petrolisthes manimaculis TaxID=1843537 RepID=A0AAE1PRK3_9EUCA|nr:hypothetical protein Pmani_015790 [Petrolisthes manimaculis]